MSGLPSGKVLSLQVGRPRGLTTSEGTHWRSAIVKEPVLGPVEISGENLEGDYQANRKYHGGPDKAICVFIAAHLPVLSQEFGLNLPYGAFGENLTVAGLDESTVCIGDTLAVGTALLQVSQPRQPCVSISKRWGVAALPKRIEQTGWTGFYCRVVRHGALETGDTLAVTQRVNPGWTILRANEIIYRRPSRPEELSALRAAPLLSIEWQNQLDKRLAAF